MISLEDLKDFVNAQLETAEQASVTLFEEKSLKANVSRYSLVSHIPRFKELEVGFGVHIWAAILFVDLRNSSQRADKFGPKPTYFTMHAFLPTMARLVVDCGGYVVGYRGDGLFAAFGINEKGENPADLNEGKEVKNAVRCGKAMMEAVDDAVSPALVDIDVPGDLRIGVGIDAGKVVITSIGLTTGFDVTAYGSAVNHAAHTSGRNGDVMISPTARRIYPKAPDGTMRFKPVPGYRDALKVHYPADYRVLKSSRQARGREVG